ncbi:MAG: site-2 protease family protein [Oscillospiraceae bacterium]|nr:site-2 protease family protein [Oscillospiraceae bacterium]MDD3832397.1 site-2 protease family protein [Oscillospiraceae bacterium]MDD4545981.1 site-2 protease family protein [Oscillospiraceae bacterium]
MLKIYISGIEYRLSLLFPAVLVVLLTLDKTGVAAWCVAASVMHEFGHFIAIYAMGSRPSGVDIGVFGVSVHQSRGKMTSHYNNMLIALAGPVVNLFSFTLLFAIFGWTTPTIVHLVMAVFNLLPIEALDGGQAVFYALAGFFGEEKAERIIYYVSIIFLIPLATTGFFLLIHSGYNYTLLAVSVYLGLLIIFKRKAD